MILRALPSDRYIRDPLHGRLVPEGRILANLMAALLPRIGEEALHQIHRGHVPVDLSRWVHPLTVASAPVIEQYWREGYRQQASELVALARGLVVRKSFLPRFLRRSPDVAVQVTKAATDFVLSVVGTLTRAVNEVVASGREVASRVRDIFSDPRKAVSVGATESHRAGMAGAITAAEQSGIVKGLKWLCSAGACRACRELEGKVVRLGEPFVVLPGGGPWATVFGPPLHPHCLTGETPVVVPGAISALKAFYRGPVVTVVLSSGDRFTSTPNHMLLTPKGFAFAGSLVKGQDVLHCPVREFASDGPGPDYHRQPTRIDEVVRSFSESSGMARRVVPVAAEYLHGDARFCEGDIDCVGANGFLANHPHWLAGYLSETGEEVVFDFGRVSAGIGESVGFTSQGDLDSVLDALLLAADGVVGRSRERQAAILASASHADGVGFAASPWRNACLEEMATDNGPGNAKGQGDRLLSLVGEVAGGNGFDIEHDPLGRASRMSRHSVASGSHLLREESGARPDGLRDTRHTLPAGVTTCKIMDIQVGSHVGPVYDVETQSSLYIIASGVISSNCRCVTEAVLMDNARPDMGWLKGMAT